MKSRPANALVANTGIWQEAAITALKMIGPTGTLYPQTPKQEKIISGGLCQLYHLIISPTVIIMKVQLFIPCFIDQLYPETAFNMVKVLEKACCDVHYNTAQTCCGQPAYNAGFRNDSADVACKFLTDFSDGYIVSPSASCGVLSELLSGNI